MQCLELQQPYQAMRMSNHPRNGIGMKKKSGCQTVEELPYQTLDHLPQLILLPERMNSYLVQVTVVLSPLWQPTPVFLPGESQGRGSLVGCRLWGHTDSNTTEATQQQQQQQQLNLILSGTMGSRKFLEGENELWLGFERWVGPRHMGMGEEVP